MVPQLAEVICFGFLGPRLSYVLVDMLSMRFTETTQQITGTFICSSEFYHVQLANKITNVRKPELFEMHNLQLSFTNIRNLCTYFVGLGTFSESGPYDMLYVRHTWKNQFTLVLSLYGVIAQLFESIL